MKAELHELLREQVARLVAGGFRNEHEIVGDAVGYVADEEGAEDEEAVAEVAERLTAQELARHLEEQQSWAIPTDCDRLDRAFAALERAAIVARQNFTCCQTCGHAEIGDELDDGSRGYAFFHVQDTDTVVDGGGLYLAYGATQSGEDATVGIGHEIVAALRKEGLTVEWNGSNRQRILVAMDWKKRRSSR